MYHSWLYKISTFCKTYTNIRMNCTKLSCYTDATQSTALLLFTAYHCCQLLRRTHAGTPWLTILVFHIHLNGFIHLQCMFNVKGTAPLNAVYNLSCTKAHTRPDTCLQTVVVCDRFHTYLWFDVELWVMTWRNIVEKIRRFGISIRSHPQARFLFSSRLRIGSKAYPETSYLSYNITPRHNPNSYISFNVAKALDHTHLWLVTTNGLSHRNIQFRRLVTGL